MIKFKISRIRHIIELLLFFGGGFLADRSESQTKSLRNCVFSDWMGYLPGFTAPIFQLKQIDQQRPFLRFPARLT